MARERERDAHKVNPLPTDNKENHEHFKSSHNGANSSPPSVPAKENTAVEDMDRVRPLGASPTSTAPIHAAMKEGHDHSHRGHKKSTSTASAAHAAREAAVLAAAASAAQDRERQASYDTRLTHAIWDLATTGANPAVDLLVCLERRHTIGFRYVDITRPVVIHHGSRDTRVPVENVRWLGKTMRRCEVRVLEGEGHGLMASAGVMGGVLMEISKEWDDWGRLTGMGRRAEAERREREREREREERGRRGTVGPVR
jgi:pimeloyl-ACP methyl ester carboxylesterase